MVGSQRIFSLSPNWPSLSLGFCLKLQFCFVPLVTLHSIYLCCRGLSFKSQCVPRTHSLLPALPPRDLRTAPQIPSCEMKYEHQLDKFSRSSQLCICPCHLELTLVGLIFCGYQEWPFFPTWNYGFMDAFAI